MRRVLALSVLLAATFAAPAARATHSQVNGSVMLPTFGSPAPGRLLFSELGPTFNGQVAYAFALPHKTGTFTLARTGGATGQEDFDIFFYATLDGVAEGVPKCTTSAPTCTQPIPSGSSYAVVTLSVGAFGSFSFR